MLQLSKTFLSSFENIPFLYFLIFLGNLWAGPGPTLPHSTQALFILNLSGLSPSVAASVFPFYHSIVSCLWHLCFKDSSQKFNFYLQPISQMWKPHIKFYEMKLSSNFALNKFLMILNHFSISFSVNFKKICPPPKRLLLFHMMSRQDGWCRMIAHLFLPLYFHHT